MLALITTQKLMYRKKKLIADIKYNLLSMYYKRNHSDSNAKKKKTIYNNTASLNVSKLRVGLLCSL